VEETARAGWAARGLLYLMVALLMSQIRGGGGREADRSGAIEAVAKAPYGGWLLAATAAGLGAFAVFRVWAAIKGDEEKPLRRVGWVGSAIVYSYLAVVAIGVLLSEDDGSGGGGGGEGQALTARVLGWPLGPWLVGAAGLVAFGVAANYVRKAVKERFRHDIDEAKVPSGLWPGVRALGVAGWCGRALVWSLVGFFLVRAAVQHDPNEPVGFDASLRAMAGEPWGPAVLWIASAGFVAYGLLCLATAAWIDEEPDS
jgi:hypothetical protein